MTNSLEKQLFSSAAGAQWQEMGVHHHHGICLPLFSLHSKNSCGIGEYSDLLPLIDWCHDLGLDIIQLLPLNDTGLGNSPYSALSAFALNPLHLSLSRLPQIEQVSKYADRLKILQKENQTDRVNYDRIRDLRYTLLQEYIPLIYPEISQTQEYKLFISNNLWLKSYALFKSIKEVLKWRDWKKWPISLKSPSLQHYQELLADFKNEINFHITIQYFCYKQFEEVKKKASKNKVLIKGDLPILISRDSADVWHHRNYFLMHLSAGAPPDMYVKEGQDWGFPAYDWKELAKDKYAFWKERLRLASHLYHLYRIDHIVGFFRIWTIPQKHLPTEGAFLPADEETWIEHGKKIMEMMLHSAPILPIGEDLGVVPETVKKCLRSLGICGTKMMRWERRWESDGKFIPLCEYPPESMTTVSTHDSDTLQLWWKHFPNEAKLYSEFKGWDYKPILSLDRQAHILHDSHHSGSLFHINLLQEYLALFPELVSSNPGDERINIPGKILPTNWTYRFRPSVEELIAHKELQRKFKKILQPI
ncbi:MAG: 4-alpha-glucanotransferase [Chlamydiia bacterium]|nr:4-alpha-glucanotransferase [Chlamydiia bacterium]